MLSFAVLFSMPAAFAPAACYADEEEIIADVSTVQETYTAGWHRIDGDWYYYLSDGTKMTNGWVKDSIGWCWLDASGRIVKAKWIKYNGAWYYLKSSGYMAANEWTKDSKGWCWMDQDGRLVTNLWIVDDGNLYYLDADGHWVTGLTDEDAEGRFTLSNAVYPTAIKVGASFSISGTLTDTNRITRVEIGVADAATDAFLPEYYYDADGLSTNSFSISNADSAIRFGKLPVGRYYFRVVAYDDLGSVQVLNKAFRVNEENVLTGWHKEDGQWHFYQDDGTLLKNGWAQDTVGWCWLDANGLIVKDKWIKVDGEWYYLKSSGYMAANEWAKDSVGWCYMTGSGRMAKSRWVQPKGEWYYIKSNGYMAASEWAKDSKGWCWMDASGRITKDKWILYKGTYYYLDDNGYWDTSLSVEGAKMLSYDPDLIAAIGKQPYSGPCGLYSMAYCRAIIDGKFPLNGYSSYQSRIIQEYGGGSSYAHWGRAGGTMQYYSTNSSLYKAVYDEITAGRPCIMNCYNPPTGNNHFVAVIGYVKGTTRSNVTLSSFIVLDPATGTLRFMGDTSYTAPTNSPYGPEIVRF